MASLAKIMCISFALLISSASATETVEDRHKQWMVQYSRTYKDATEREYRFNIFKDNLEYIESFNAEEKHRYKLGTNQFADLTNEEFKVAHNGFKPSNANSAAKPKGTFQYVNYTDAPAAMDWRTKGAVTPIKNQGQCGCCWAFSAVAATEGINKLTTGKLVSLSEQELVDCDIEGNDQGCNGGLMDDAFEFIIKNKGLTTETNYPYKAADGTCSSNKEANHAAAITGYEDVPTNDEASLLKAAANQPISVAIDASGSDFQLYSSGVFTGECGTDLDHGVTVVGYGVTSDGMKYWLVKNSWGVSWGENGYIRMERDVDAEEGICGIAMQPSYPTA